MLRRFIKWRHNEDERGERDILDHSPHVLGLKKVVTGDQRL